MRATWAAELVRRHFVLTTYVLAVLPRLALLVALGPTGGADTRGYRLAADALASSALTSSDAFLGLPPVLPLYVALVPNSWAAIFGQILVASLVGPLLGLAARRHFGVFAGWAVGILAAFEPSFVFWSRYLLTDSFGLTFLAAAIERTSAGFASHRVGAAATAGAAAGLGFLSRAAIGPPALVLAAAHAVTGRARRARTLAFVGALAAVLLVPTVRNVLAVGEVRPYRDQGWELIWQGTQWNEIGRATGGIDIFYPANFDSLTQAERQAFFQREVIAFVEQHPGAAVEQLIKKAFWFWVPFYPEWSALHKAWSAVYFLGLYAVALVGLWTRRRDAFARLLVALIAAVTAMVMVTVVDYDGRYRLAAELGLLPLAAAGVVRLRDAVARRAVEPSSAIA